MQEERELTEYEKRLLEEAELYFDGDITSEEAAERIQKRVSEYMADYREE